MQFVGPCERMTCRRPPDTIGIALSWCVPTGLIRVPPSLLQNDAPRPVFMRSYRGPGSPARPGGDPLIRSGWREPADEADLDGEFHAVEVAAALADLGRLGFSKGRLGD